MWTRLVSLAEVSGKYLPVGAVESELHTLKRDTLNGFIFERRRRNNEKFKLGFTGQLSLFLLDTTEKIIGGHLLFVGSPGMR